MSDFVQHNSTTIAFDTADNWVILSPIEMSIKRKIEAVGTPLRDWDIQINYGIKTGYNDAFIISTEKLNEILAACADEEERQRTEELIRPYIPLQDNKGELANLYENCGFDTFTRKGDIYCLFYERGYQLLREGGILCYITSNKWMRSDYGQQTRQFFFKKTNPVLLIDFGGIKVFESATVDTNVLLYVKGKNTKSTICSVVTKQNKESLYNLSDFVQHNSTTIAFGSAENWSILSPIELSIKKKIESVGVPLRDWDIQIYRGVLTGYNKAFIISTEKRDEILDNCLTEDERQRTEELIRPILRGRDIKRYGYDWAKIWLINAHNGIRGKLERIHIEDYPAVKAHLDKYWPKLVSRADRGDTPYNLRNCAYLDDFSQPKIIYPETTLGAYFAYDEDHYIADKTCFILLTEYPRYLISTLSSALFEIAYKRIFSAIELGANGYQYNKHAFIKLPIAAPVEDKYLTDDEIYKLYNLSDAEIKFVEDSRSL